MEISNHFQKIKSYSLEMKAQVCKDCEANALSCTDASRKYKIHERNVQKWIKLGGSKYFEQLIEEYMKKNIQDRKKNRSQKPQYPDIEIELKNEIIRRETSGFCRDAKYWLPQKAKELHHKYYVEEKKENENDFVASSGWCYNFIKRHLDITLKKVTSNQFISKDEYLELSSVCFIYV
jgi:Tc5 transposase-like DNA-binding protein